jgi:hypothetical protein
MPRNRRSPENRAHPRDAVYSLSDRIGLGEDSQGIITLSDPQDHKIQQFFRRLRFRIPPERRLTLDEYGSFVVRQIDGSASVAEIGRKLKEEFGPGAEPLFERLVPYLSALEQQRLIVRI